MLGQKPVRAVGWNLGLRLYLALVAIILPTFFSYYVYTIRTIEMLHESEVEDVIRMASQRVEDWAGAFASLDQPSEKEREAVGRELRRITAEPNGIEGLSLFAVTTEGLLSPVASAGPAALGKPVAEDADALTQARQQKMDVLRGERTFQSVSVPMRVGGEIRGVLHLEVVPTKIGLGLRIREVRTTMLLGATGLVLAVGCGVALFFQYCVRRPIRQRTDAMENAAEGNLS